VRDAIESAAGAKYSPFVIVDPRPVAIDCYFGGIIRERSMFPWWNHWPVSQRIRSTGRWAVAPDRVSHSSLTHIQSWKPHEERPDGVTMVMLNGLTTGTVTDLLPLAKSWLEAPSAQLKSAGFESQGFDRTEGAYVFARRDPSAAVIDVTLQASAGSPLVKPVLVIKNWNAASAKVRVDNKPPASTRKGITHRLDGEDLVARLFQRTERIGGRSRRTPRRWRVEVPCDKCDSIVRQWSD